MSEISQVESPISKDEQFAMRVEALLFVSPRPVTISQLAASLECTNTKVKNTIKFLKEQYQNRGIRIQEHKSQYQLTSAPEYGEDVENFLNIELTSKLSRAAVEALAIIAYKQPVTRPSVDAIRGVNSDGVMRSLLNKGLIEELGRSDGPGRPILYGTTPDFLQHFGLDNLDQLPEFELINSPEDADPNETTNGQIRLLKD